MPNRILRDWTDSDAINALSAEQERLFVRLIMVVDDFGCFYADPRRVKVSCFPFNESVTFEHVAKWLRALSPRLVRLYAADGKEYLEIRNFNQRLRQMRRKFPEPPKENLNPETNPRIETNALVSQLTDNCQSFDGQLTVNCQTDETAEKRQQAAKRDEDFAKFWEAYPKKVAKAHAEKAFAKAIKHTGLETMLAALQVQSASVDWNKDGGQYIPNPATWLNGARWDDTPVAIQKSGNQSGPKRDARGRIPFVDYMPDAPIPEGPRPDPKELFAKLRAEAEAAAKAKEDAENPFNESSHDL
jgi:hypothetical protein